MSTDPLTRSGYDHYYELEYDASIHDFERVLAQHPDDPFAVNHLAAAVFFKELYRAGALESGLYSSNSFLSNHTPIEIDPVTDARLKQLFESAIQLSDQRIAADPNDAKAYYARGVARGLQATYTALVKKSYFSALGNAKASRRDHEKVLELDPSYSDARLVVGVHSFIVGSLPWAMRILAHVVGEGGNRAEGLRDIKAAADGGGEASVDAKVVLALFLRREQRYDEALQVQRSLTKSYPRNFLFALEEANILKDKGAGEESIATYHRLLDAATKGDYKDPQLEFAYYGLGEALRGQHDYAEAAKAYAAVAALPHAYADIKVRSELGAGEMYDLLRQRQQAITRYQSVISQAPSSEQAATARKYLKGAYSE